jgi:hypothetical protein
MVTFVRGRSTFNTPGEIYVKTLPDVEAVPLTNDGLNKMSPVFSPDGARIAYTVVEGGRWDSWQVQVIGGQARLWLDNASGLTWTGKDRVLFSEIKDNNIHMAIVSAKDNRAEARDVYVPGKKSGMAHRSYLSPDGKWALIVEMENGPWVPIGLDGRPVTGAPGWSAERRLHDCRLVSRWEVDVSEFERGRGIPYVAAAISRRRAGTDHLRANARRRDRDGFGWGVFRDGCGREAEFGLGAWTGRGKASFAGGFCL